MLRDQGRDHHRVDVGLLEIDQRARPVKDTARRNHQRAGKSEIAKRFRSFLVEVQVIGRASFRCHPRIPGSCALRAFFWQILRLRVRIVRVGVASRGFRLQSFRQIQSAVGIDKSRVNRFPGEIPNPRFGRDLHIRSHFDDQSVANENYAFLDRFPGRRDDTRVSESVNSRIVLSNALLRDGGDLRKVGRRQE
jgi:hypothetical protein